MRKALIYSKIVLPLALLIAAFVFKQQIFGELSNSIAPWERKIVQIVNDTHAGTAEQRGESRFQAYRIHKHQRSLL